MRSSRRLPVLAPAAPSIFSYPDQAQPADGGGTDTTPTAKQFLAIVRAHWLATLIIVAAVVIPTALVVKFFVPKTYVAVATLLVNYAAPDALERQDGNAVMMTNYMSTRVQLMKSAEVLSPVIQKLRLTDDAEFMAGFSGGNETARINYVMDALYKNVDVEQGAFGSQLLYVEAAARDPVKAATIANTVSEVYSDLELHRQTGPATERARRYAEQLAELKTKVAAAQEQVTAFRKRTGVAADVTPQSSVDTELLTSLEQRYLDAQNLRRAAEVRAAANQSTSTAYTGSGMVQELRAKVASLEGQMAQLGQTLGPNHPKVRELQSQLDSTRASLAAEVQNVSSNANGELVSARQLEEKLHAAVEQQRAKVLGVRALQDEGAKYALELESAQSVYKRALDGYDEIMFAAGGHTTEVLFVSRAAPPIKAARPNKIKIMMLTLIAGLILGLAAPLAYELLVERRIRCADDLERSFSIPVLVELDEIPALAGQT